MRHDTQDINFYNLAYLDPFFSGNKVKLMINIISSILNLVVKYIIYIYMYKN